MDLDESLIDVTDTSPCKNSNNSKNVSSLKDKTNRIIIEYVEQNPCLYDPNDPSHRNHTRTSEAWHKIARSLNMPEEFVRKRWQQLRQRYAKVRRHRLSNRPIATFRLFDKLTFLDVHLTELEKWREMNKNLKASTSIDDETVQEILGCSMLQESMEEVEECGRIVKEEASSLDDESAYADVDSQDNKNGSFASASNISLAAVPPLYNSTPNRLTSSIRANQNLPNFLFPSPIGKMPSNLSAQSQHVDPPNDLITSQQELITDSRLLKSDIAFANYLLATLAELPQEKRLRAKSVITESLHKFLANL